MLDIFFVNLVIFIISVIGIAIFYVWEKKELLKDHPRMNHCELFASMYVWLSGLMIMSFITCIMMWTRGLVDISITS